MRLPPRLKKATMVVAVILVASGVLIGGLVATGVFSQPTVEGIEKGWGAVTNDSTQIETTVQVDNPNPIGIPGLISVEYSASLNDVVLTENRKSGIGLSPGKNRISLSSAMPNDRIADWWVTHVNDGEQSTLRIEPSVSAPGYSSTLPTRTSQIETDLLSSFGSSGSETISIGNQSLLVLSDQQASWGTATSETTPLTFAATIQNVHDYGIELEGVEYLVTMNSVTLGSGRTTDGVTVAPGESGTLTVDAALNTGAFADWWPTHVRNNETSQMAVELYGIVEQNGTTKRLPLTLYQQRLEFDTQLLGGGQTTVEALPTERGSITVPTLSDTERQWGEVTNATTEILTDLRVDNPNTDPAINDFARLSMTSETTVNGVLFGTGSRSGMTLSPGTQELRLTSVLDNEAVPSWWARHLNNGESSTMMTDTTATVDLGFTTLSPPTQSPRSTFQTDLLAGFNTTEPQPIEQDGRTYLVAESTSATWDTATPQEAPLHVQSILRNEQPAPITVEQFSYTVSINDVTLADETNQKGTVIAPGETETVALRMLLDNSKMDEWWATHIRNDETSVLDINATVTISAVGQTRTVPLEMFSQDTTVETDILGTDT